MQIKMSISNIYETVILQKPCRKCQLPPSQLLLHVLFNLGWMNVITARMQILRDHICLHLIKGLKSLKPVFKRKFRKILVVH